MTDDFFSPEEVIDRDQEVREFDGLLGDVQKPCLLTIHDTRGGVGKSKLMRLLQHRAWYERAVPAVYVEVQSGRDRFWLMEQIAEKLSNEIGVPLPSYARLDEARRREDTGAFSKGRSAVSLPPASVNVEGPGGVGAHATVIGAQNPTYVLSPDTWSAGWDVLARRRCLDAFLDDLRDACTTGRVVILIDQYERTHSGDMHHWLLGTLRNRVFPSADAFRGFLLVLAGTKVPVPELRGILGEDFSRHVSCIDGLSAWSDDHVTEWLHRIGVPYDPEDVPFIREKLARNWTLQQVKMRLFDQLDISNRGST